MTNVPNESPAVNDPTRPERSPANYPIAKQPKGKKAKKAPVPVETKASRESQQRSEKVKELLSDPRWIFCKTPGGTKVETFELCELLDFYDTGHAGEECSCTDADLEAAKVVYPM